MRADGEEKLWKVFFWALNVVVSLLTTFTIFMATKVLENDRRLVAVEHSRCTSESCGTFSTSIANLETRLSYLPHTYVSERDFQEIKKRIEDMEKRKWTKEDWQYGRK